MLRRRTVLLAALAASGHAAANGWQDANEAELADVERWLTMPYYYDPTVAQSCPIRDVRTLKDSIVVVTLQGCQERCQPLARVAVPRAAEEAVWLMVGYSKSCRRPQRRNHKTLSPCPGPFCAGQSRQTLLYETPAGR